MNNSKLFVEVLSRMSAALKEQASAVDDMIVLLGDDEPEKKISDPNKRRKKTNTCLLYTSPSPRD